MAMEKWLTLLKTGALTPGWSLVSSLVYSFWNVWEGSHLSTGDESEIFYTLISYSNNSESTIGWISIDFKDLNKFK